MIYAFVTTSDFRVERPKSQCGGINKTTNQSVSKNRENLIDRTHNSLKAERYLCRISMQMTFNIFQIYFMAACHTNICYPIHLTATLFQPTRRRCRVRMLGCFCLRCGLFFFFVVFEKM
jgi:hypothetical protein